jgi:hypothetical protein
LRFETCRPYHSAVNRSLPQVFSATALTFSVGAVILIAEGFSAAQK